MLLDGIMHVIFMEHNKFQKAECIDRPVHIFYSMHVHVKSIQVHICTVRHTTSRSSSCMP